MIAASDPSLGLRLVGGIDYLFDTAPFDIFAEVVPIVDVVPSTEVGVEGALGARYFF